MLTDLECESGADTISVQDTEPRFSFDWESDSEASSDENPQPRDLIPSHRRPTGAGDIRGELETTFWTSEHVFEGKYWYQHSSNGDVTPMLRIDDSGVIDLPLQPAEAKVLISHRQQTPFKAGELPVIGSWEVDPSAVHIDNPLDWQDFLDRQVVRLSQQLGVDHEVSRPQCELHKLLIYGPGFRLDSCTNSPKVDGMFASMIVLLPSEFAGGAVHLSHGENSTVLDLSAESASNTSILAWFTDITHELKSITRGYQLALSYNIIHTIPILRPYFTPPSSIVESFRNVLVSWKDREDATPFKIVFLLSYKYSSVGFSSSSLKGSDAQVVAILKDLGQELGFRLALATVAYYTGQTEWASGNLGMNTPMNLEGEELSHLTGFKRDKSETIPASLKGSIVLGLASKRINVDNTNGLGYSPRWYHRTVLLLWPERHTIELEYGRDFSPMFEALRRTQSITPNGQERRVTDYLLRATMSRRVHHKSAFRSICHAAACWKDHELWRRAVAVCGGSQSLYFLARGGLPEAVLHLGFANIQSTIENLLRIEWSNYFRFKALQTLEHLQVTGQAQDIPADWIGAQYRSIIITEPQATADALLLFLEFFSRVDPLSRANIISQLMDLAHPPFLLHFACLLHSEKSSFTTWDDGITSVNEVKELLSNAISKAKFSEPRLDGRWSWVTPEFSHFCLLACLKTDNEGLGAVVIQGLLSRAEKERRELNNSGKDTARVLIPLMPLLANTLRAYPRLSSLPGIDKLYLAAIRVALNSEHHLLGLAAAVWLGGDIKLVETIAPQLESLQPDIRARVKTKLQSLLGSVLNPSEEDWRPILEQFLKHIDITQAPPGEV